MPRGRSQGRAGVPAAAWTGDAVRGWAGLALSGAGLGGPVDALVHEFEEVLVQDEPARDPDRCYFQRLLPGGA